MSDSIGEMTRQINRAVRTMIAFDRLRCLNGDNAQAAVVAITRCPYDWGSMTLVVTPRGDFWRMFNLGLN